MILTVNVNLKTVQSQDSYALPLDLGHVIESTQIFTCEEKVTVEINFCELRQKLEV